MGFRVISFSQLKKQNKKKIIYVVHTSMGRSAIQQIDVQECTHHTHADAYRRATLKYYPILALCISTDMQIETKNDLDTKCVVLINNHSSLKDFFSS